MGKDISVQDGDRGGGGGGGCPICRECLCHCCLACRTSDLGLTASALLLL